MKKASLQSLINYLDGQTVTNIDEIKAELEAELAKSKAKADANRAIYDEMHDIVMNTLRSATAPVTAQEIADATSLSRSKITHGLTNYWANEVVVHKTPGKTNLYSLS